MATIWLPQSARVTDYGAAVKGPKAIVTIKIEVGEPGALGYLLEDLGKAKQEGAPAKPAPKPARLLLTDQREG